MMPGAAKVSEEQLSKGELEFIRTEAIIQSMTKEERQNPSLLNASRRKRIAAGAGVTVTAVNSVIKKYEDTKKMMKQFNNAKGNKRLARRFGF